LDAFARVGGSPQPRFGIARRKQKSQGMWKTFSNSFQQSKTEIGRKTFGKHVTTKTLGM